MGNNDSFPPPPSGPFGPPSQPPTPSQPATPSLPPLAPPSGPAPLPPPAPSAPPPTGPTPQMPAPFGPAPAPEKSRAPLVLIGLVLAFALGVGAYFVFKKDDHKAVAPARTTLPAVDTTVPDTFVITAPAVTEPAVTSPGSVPTGTDAGPPDITVTDDTKFFTVQLPGDFKTDTQPIDSGGSKIAQISGSRDLVAYNGGHDELGATVLGGPADTLQAPADLVNILDPGPTVCTDRSQQSGVTTQVGVAEVLFIDGCGPNKASKVVLAVEFTGTKDVFVVAAQGAGPANGALLNFAQAVLETIHPS